MNNLTLGSLFDGSGGFPLGAVLNGIIPVWASEIEPFPIRVTTKRFPNMLHLGDISKINGGEIPPVDIITFGSPCTDLSLAGKRAGIGGSQSKLFYEAIRIIREMRCKTNGRYPRFIVWENVPGAYSSAKGADFRCVLEKIVKTADKGEGRPPTHSVPMPEKKWLQAGSIMGDDFSVAWRTLDSQFWGVPQRRRRIYLVADFGGFTAPKILFESEGMPWDSAQSGKPWQAAASDAEGGAAPSSENPPSIGFEPGAMSRLGGYFDIELTGTLRAKMGDNQTCVAVMGERQHGLPITFDKAPCLLSSDYKGSSCVFENHSQDTRYVGPIEKAQTVSATYGEGGNNQPFVVDKCQKTYGICSDGSNSMKSDNPSSGIYDADTSRTIDASGGNPGCNQGGMAVVSIQGSMIGRKDENGPNGSGINEDVSFTLNTSDKHAVVYSIDRESFNCGSNFARNMGIEDDGIASTLNAQGPSAVSTSDTAYTVRRLTPLECSRLQGFPDCWCDDLETENPTEADILFWKDVFETHRKIMGTSSKPKTEKQIIKWLKNPSSDSAEYKMWGNGVALPCVCYVLAGIAYCTQK